MQINATDQHVKIKIFVAKIAETNVDIALMIFMITVLNHTDNCTELIDDANDEPYCDKSEKDESTCQDLHEQACF